VVARPTFADFPNVLWIQMFRGGSKAVDSGLDCYLDNTVSSAFPILSSRTVSSTSRK
jgi:hypothetical protein